MWLWYINIWILVSSLMCCWDSFSLYNLWVKTGALKEISLCNKSDALPQSKSKTIIWKTVPGAKQGQHISTLLDGGLFHIAQNCVTSKLGSMGFDLYPDLPPPGIPRLWLLCSRQLKQNKRKSAKLSSYRPSCGIHIIVIIITKLYGIYDHIYLHLH